MILTTHQPVMKGGDLWDEIFDAALIVNPAFDIYRIFDTVCGAIAFFLSTDFLFNLVSHTLGCARISVSQLGDVCKMAV